MVLNGLAPAKLLTLLWYLPSSSSPMEFLRALVPNLRRKGDHHALGVCPPVPEAILEPPLSGPDLGVG